MIPKPGDYKNEIKNIQIKETIGEFIPNGAEFLTNIKNYCSPEGELSVHAKTLGVQLKFKLNV
jgi:hypothetical protein